MTSYELISTISLTFTAIIAVSSFLVPLILNQRNLRRKEKQEIFEKIENEKQKEFEIILNEQYTIISDLDEAYGEWVILQNNNNFIKAIYKCMSYFEEGCTRNELKYLAQLTESSDKKRIISRYDYSRKVIFEAFGLDTTTTDNKLIKAELRRALRKKLKMNSIY